MAMNLSIDLQDATFGDLVALIRAAQAAGVDNATRLELEDTTLLVNIVAPAVGSANLATAEDFGGADGASGRHSRGHEPLPALGDSAIRSVIDILTGRQEPPR
ncbi:hypothetical protein [Corynebacterium sp. CCUG 70398]|uniref:hypothetical protein n=1 Tax=Corynebacterium sp. CCUG 70398 TaxID=2823891 RepID=UPI002108E834|nr:hypothetical protein [Corynebacterium sp. CCUG 70398]MCQ4622677.1 hypothetical protein [Corynebacterium sp. CCUG 70398]